VSTEKPGINVWPNVSLTQDKPNNQSQSNAFLRLELVYTICMTPTNYNNNNNNNNNNGFFVRIFDGFLRDLVQQITNSDLSDMQVDSG